MDFIIQLSPWLIALHKVFKKKKELLRQEFKILLTLSIPLINSLDPLVVDQTKDKYRDGART